MLVWRLIYDFPTAGAINMAIDEAVLNGVAAGQAPPTLRLYGWMPACLSLGYGQRSADVDFERLAAQGWDAVRRATGGRAILHTDELTYSLALPAGHAIAAGDVVESYRQISRALVLALELLGARPHADRRSERGGTNGAVCFETPSHYEITVEGRKLVGSAQVRRRGGILQHGTLPLMGDVARICEALVYADEAEREAAKLQVRERAITLSQAVGRDVTWEEAAAAVCRAFEQTFEIVLETDCLSADEVYAVKQLAEGVYGSSDFTLRR